MAPKIQSLPHLLTTIERFNSNSLQLNEVSVQTSAAVIIYGYASQVKTVIEATVSISTIA